MNSLILLGLFKIQRKFLIKFKKSYKMVGFDKTYPAGQLNFAMVARLDNMPVELRPKKDLLEPHFTEPVCLLFPCTSYSVNLWHLGCFHISQRRELMQPAYYLLYGTQDFKVLKKIKIIKETEERANQ